MKFLLRLEELLCAQLIELWANIETLLWINAFLLLSCLGLTQLIDLKAQKNNLFESWLQHFKTIFLCLHKLWQLAKDETQHTRDTSIRYVWLCSLSDWIYNIQPFHERSKCWERSLIELRARKHTQNVRWGEGKKNLLTHFSIESSSSSSRQQVNWKSQSMLSSSSGHFKIDLGAGVWSYLIFRELAKVPTFFTRNDEKSRKQQGASRG